MKEVSLTLPMNEELYPLSNLINRCHWAGVVDDTF